MVAQSAVPWQQALRILLHRMFVCCWLVLLCIYLMNSQ